jgi:hypothetical protein
LPEDAQSPDTVMPWLLPIVIEPEDSVRVLRDNTPETIDRLPVTINELTPVKLVIVIEIPPLREKLPAPVIAPNVTEPMAESVVDRLEDTPAKPIAPALIEHVPTVVRAAEELTWKLEATSAVLFIDTATRLLRLFCTLMVGVFKISGELNGAAAVHVMVLAPSRARVTLRDPLPVLTVMLPVGAMSTTPPGAEALSTPVLIVPLVVVRRSVVEGLVTIPLKLIAPAPVLIVQDPGAVSAPVAVMARLVVFKLPLTQSTELKEVNETVGITLLSTTSGPENVPGGVQTDKPSPANLRVVVPAN